MSSFKFKNSLINYPNYSPGRSIYQSIKISKPILAIDSEYTFETNRRSIHDLKIHITWATVAFWYFEQSNI